MFPYSHVLAGSVRSVYTRFPQSHSLLFATCVACLTGFLFGFSIASLTPLLPTNAYRHYFHHPDSTASGGIQAANSAGAVFGSLLSPSVSDALGRKCSLHVSCILWCIGCGIQSGSTGVAMLVVGRVIAGVGIGFGVAAAPMYCVELAPPRVRGTVVGIFQLAVTAGILVLFFIGYGCSFLHSTAVFRVTWALQIVPGIAAFFLIFFIPESPRWLASHRRWDDATQIICRIGETRLLRKRDNRKEQISMQLDELKDYILTDRYAAVFSYRDLFKRKTIMKTIVGFCSQMWQALCGINMIMFYVTYIFQMAGYKGSSLIVASSIECILNFVLTILVLFVLDRIGRRPLLIVGGIFMCIFMFIIMALLVSFSVPAPEGGWEGNPTITIYIPDQHSSAAKTVIAMSYLFVCTFATTWGVGIWIYYNEIFNNTERAKGTAFSVCGNWLCNFAIALFIPSSFKSITWKTYIIFGVFCFVLIIHTFLMFPETNKKTLEEIDLMWDSHIPAWKSTHWKPEVKQIQDPCECTTKQDSPTPPIIEKPQSLHIEKPFETIPHVIYNEPPLAYTNTQDTPINDTLHDTFNDMHIAIPHGSFNNSHLAISHDTFPDMTAHVSPQVSSNDSLLAPITSANRGNITNDAFILSNIKIQQLSTPY
ncbi:hypothetical protein TBLA_0C01100 [Henningerozyma blattae CBS 6284]|uniref:Major facilitator superfamily (MFS) profile domain-containing protein n=1 Tax=Henningerozyma blattae (strain ATCC 34711 / CBS 6284 / DSM 70876 / NBRC 10599 / NRRL Y-10934 / UCD 77-7) TaxID=1071380 RepID=I2H0M3_HENB6|nr:hypothetical protein TBLA_0C01100 [Tetrapisispora blattae CBS 6284]CCH59925.1 hypothetical protein TBLA_0C01100 [Tetrapisispora blattae CBS 6284]